MPEGSGWKLVTVDGQDSGRTYPLTERGMVLGRSEECEVMLASHNVSRKHARFFIYLGEAYVQDLGSRNGVFVNGSRAQQQGLKAGDSITMGEFVFRLESSNAPVLSPSNNRRKLLLGATGLIAALLVVAAVLTGRGSVATPVPSAPAEGGSQPSDVQHMFSTLEKSPKAPPARVPLVDNPATTQEVPANSAGDKRNQMVRDYLDRAQLLQDAGKLTEAREQYERALKLDPGCQLCLVRRERIEKEIGGLIQRHLDDGMKAFKALRYEEAVGSWELVLNLSPDPGSQPHQQATKFISDAQVKLDSQRF